MKQEIEFTSIPGSVRFLNAHLMPSENVVVCSALVYDEYDVVTQPERRHYKLLEEMVQAGHYGTLDHFQPTIRITCPIFVARHLVKSSNSVYNEKSARYGKSLPRFYKPGAFFKDVKRKALSEKPTLVEDQAVCDEIYANSCKHSWASYNSLLNQGVRKEQASRILPVTGFTEIWMSLRFSDWLHFLNLRTDSHAQYETRYIANQIMELFDVMFPSIMGFWKKYAKGPINEYGTIQTP